METIGNLLDPRPQSETNFVEALLPHPMVSPHCGPSHARQGPGGRQEGLTTSKLAPCTLCSPYFAAASSGASLHR